MPKAKTVLKTNDKAPKSKLAQFCKDQTELQNILHHDQHLPIKEEEANKNSKKI